MAKRQVYSNSGGASTQEGAKSGKQMSIYIHSQLKEENEFFEIASSGHSHTLESLYSKIQERGVSSKNISRKALGQFLENCKYYSKHERYEKASMDTTRYSLDHRQARPGAFLHDMSRRQLDQSDEKLKEDGALFILSLARACRSKEGQGGEIVTGEVLFKDFQRLMREYLGMELNMPGKAIKPINIRTRIIKYAMNSDGRSVTRDVVEGIAISKMEARDKTVKYKFAPSASSRW